MAILGICIVWFLLWGILMIVSSLWVKTGEPQKVRKGGILGLISSILGANILGIIGAIVALIWKQPS
jgi:hypothetical protein